MIEIVPSILSADFRPSGRGDRPRGAGRRSILHLDVMDGHFVPNLTIGPPVVESIRKATRLTPGRAPDDRDPGAKYAPVFVEAGADSGVGAPGSHAATWTGRCG